MRGRGTVLQQQIGNTISKPAGVNLRQNNRRRIFLPRRRRQTDVQGFRWGGLAFSPQRYLPGASSVFMTSRADPWQVVRLLAFAQIVSWGSRYYALAILAPDLQREFGWRAELVFGAYAYSWGQLVAGIGFVLLATTHSLLYYFFAWAAIGMAMAMTLYEAAFTTINREFLRQACRSISVLTLSGGVASTVFWPLTLQLNNMLGWRATLLVYAAVQVLLCLPLHALLRGYRSRRSLLR